MACRKWVVRGLVFAVAAALGGGGLVYQHWTDPAAVRRQLHDKLAARLPGAQVTLESARMRLLGGIAVSELRLSRRDDPDSATFLYVPSAVIYHDKERLLDGTLALRKIELERPRLRLIRDRDGRWNLGGLLAPPNLRERIPTIVIRHGSLVIEDRASGAPPIEIKDVALKVLNDPETVVTFEGAGTSETVGPVQLSGAWQRDSNAATLTLDAPAIPLGPALTQRLAALCPQAAEHAADLHGVCRLHASLTHHPAASRPWGHDVHLTLTKGRLNHRRLPLPLEDLEASLRCTDGHVPRVEATARSGPATLRLTATDVKLPIGEASACPVTLDALARKLDIKIDNLPVTADLFKPLPEKYQKIYNDYAPSGTADVTYEVRPEGHGPWRRRLLVEPRGLKVTFVKFPYTVDDVTGSVEQLSGGPDGEVINLNAVCRAAGQPVYVKGEIKGQAPDVNATIDVWGKNVPIDDKLLFALESASKECRKVADQFSPTGLVDFHTHSRRTPEAKTWNLRHVVTFHHATVRYDNFPYRLENVSGVLDVLSPERWEAYDFRGRHGDGLLYVSGRGWPSPEGRRVRVEVAGRGVDLDDDLKTALRPQELGRTWETFAPSGRIDFDGTIDVPPGQPAKPDIDLTVQPRGCAIRPRFFPYPLSDLRGTLHYAHDTVELENMTARHDRSILSLDRGVVRLKPGGGFKADLTALRGSPLVPDADFANALRKPLHEAWKALDVQGPLDFRTRLYIDAAAGSDPPRIYWDGAVTLRDAALRTGVRWEHVSGTVASRGWFNGTALDGMGGNLDVREATVFGQPLRNVRGEIVVTEDEPEVLKMPGLMAGFFGGQVYGPVRVEFGPRVRYEVNLTASQVKLEEFGKHNFAAPAEVKGLAVARLYLRGEGPDAGSLRGSGKLDVPSGKIYNLPVLLDLLKFLSLRLPDRTFFEEAHAAFDIEGMRAHVRRLELYGNVISLRGKGDMNLDGSDIDLDLNVDWARLGQVLPPGVRAIPREISNQLFKIEMRGRLGDVRFNQQPVPLLTDPLKRMMRGEPDK
jgi:hypothetical protein